MGAICVCFYEGGSSSYLWGGRVGEVVEKVIWFEEGVAGKTRCRPRDSLLEGRM